MKICFSEEKLIKRFGNPAPLSKRTPLSTNPPISEQLFHEPPLCYNFKNKNQPVPLILFGKKTMNGIIDIKNCATLNIFKEKIRKWEPNNCKCLVFHTFGILDV